MYTVCYCRTIFYFFGMSRGRGGWQHGLHPSFIFYFFRHERWSGGWQHGLHPPFSLSACCRGIMSRGPVVGSMSCTHPFLFMLHEGNQHGLKYLKCVGNQHELKVPMWQLGMRYVN
jgi:hypothetical protein